MELKFDRIITWLYLDLESQRPTGPGFLLSTYYKTACYIYKKHLFFERLTSAKIYFSS